MNTDHVVAGIVDASNRVRVVGGEIEQLNKHVGQLNQHVGALHQSIGEADQNLREHLKLLTDSINSNARSQDRLSGRLVLATIALVLATLVIAGVEWYNARAEHSDHPTAPQGAPGKP